MRKMRHKIFLCILFLSTGSTLLSAPVLRVGIITDTHVTDDKNSCVLLEKALRLFKKQKADMVINAGDIADSYNVRAYRNYRETVSKIYRGEKPREIFVYANHDWIGRKSTPVRQVFQDVKKHLEIPNAPYDTVKYKGYTFVIVPQFADMARYKNMLDKAVKDNPGKPVFVVDHVPPADTVFATDGLSGERRKLLDHYPSVILLCGHKHNTLASELAIWQGNFTVVHAGCLQKWRLFLVYYSRLSNSSSSLWREWVF